MKTYIYCVHDSKAQVFCKPFTSENDATALRAYQYAANDKDSEIGKYPSDFTLYKIGAFDDQTGELLSTQPQAIALAATLVNQTEVNANGL